jgi:hypothetical protein
MDERRLRILPAARRYWGELAAKKGAIAASRELLITLWEFLLDSTPARSRLRFGDADYDWDVRVNTTSGAVAWRDRLLGVFHSPYQPTDPALFHEMMAALEEHARIEFANFTFIDLGSGKGRALLLASDYPFHRIVGVELLPALHAIAQENLAQYKQESQRCFALESICADAAVFPLPDGPLVIYIFNPFPETALSTALTNIEDALRANHRPVYVLYHNPQLEQLLTGNSQFTKLAGTHQYSIFRAGVGGS